MNPDQKEPDVYDVITGRRKIGYRLDGRVAIECFSDRIQVDWGGWAYKVTAGPGRVSRPFFSHAANRKDLWYNDRDDKTERNNAMNQKARKRNTCLFIGFLLLGGIFHYFDPTENLALNSFLFSGRFAIFAGLVLFWIRSVRSRLLPTRVRTYLTAAGVLMLSLLVIQVFSTRIVGDSVDPVWVSRCSKYAYWVPQMLIPALFLMAGVRICRGGQDGAGLDERLLMIPALFLSLMMLTNDLHHLIYRPKADYPELMIITGRYTHGPWFYLLYAWMILACVAGLILLFRETGRRPAKGIALLAGAALAWLVMLLLNLLVFDLLRVHQPYSTQEINIFGMLGIFEICIRNRLIASNENHTGFFAKLGLPVLITGPDLSPAYTTDCPLNASEEDLRASLRGPVCPREDTRLSGMGIRAGYAFWAEDESELHRENRRLESANEILSEENHLIGIENSLKEKKAHLDARNRVYDRIAAAILSRQRRISALLAGAKPADASFRRVLGECCVLNAWCKRKSNLLLLDEASLPVKNRELYLALQESARFLKCCGVEAAAVGDEETDFPLQNVHDLYDTFEAVIESWLPALRRLTVSLTDSGIRMAVETGEDLPLPETVLPVEKKSSEGTVFLTVRCGKGGGAV